MNTQTRRSLTVATAFVATAFVATVGLTGCSGDDDTAALPVEPTPPPATKSAVTTTAAVDPALAGLVGPGCASYATQVPTGAGSVAGMAEAPLATAARKNPQLTTLTAAVSGKLNKNVTLVDTLNGGEYTVFAPVDTAFAKLPAANIALLKTNGLLLTKLLTHHVVAGQLSPKQVVGTQKTVEGGDIKITGSGDALKVGDANVICGGIKTANATLYLIDKVLTPPR